jgi:S-adenosylmethionine:tRNA ribosyltransferase-isomerase
LGDLPCSLRSATYTYELPQAQVAQEPPARRQDARLLELGLTAPGGCQLGDFLIESLPGLLRPGDLLVLNDTRVLKARVRGHREATGGQAEALILDTSAGACEALLRTRGHPAPGETFIFAGKRLRATVVQPLGGGLYRMKTSGATKRVTRGTPLTATATRPCTRNGRAQSPRRPPGCT